MKPIEPYFVAIVTGGRDFRLPVEIDKMLSLTRIKEVFVGDCPTGVDLFTRAWCRTSGIPFTVFDADWDTYHKGAGPIRNRKMVDAAVARGEELGLPVVCIAFPGGRGTADCTRYALSKSVPIWRSQ